MDYAVTKAHRKIIEAIESMTSWKMSQDALLIRKVDSLSSLGFKMQGVPNLHRLIVTGLLVHWRGLKTLSNCFFWSGKVRERLEIEHIVYVGIFRFVKSELCTLSRTM